MSAPTPISNRNVSMIVGMSTFFCKFRNFFTISRTLEGMPWIRDGRGAASPLEGRLKQLVGVERRRPTELRGTDHRQGFLDADPGFRLGLRRLLDLPPGRAILLATDVRPPARDFLPDQKRPVPFQAELAEPVQQGQVVVRSGAVFLVIRHHLGGAANVALLPTVPPEPDSARPRRQEGSAARPTPLPAGRHYWGREIPSFLIFSCKVERFIPMWAAAPSARQPTSRSHGGHRGCAPARRRPASPPRQSALGPAPSRPTVVFGKDHLRHLVSEYILHYNQEHPHQSQDNRPPCSAGPLATESVGERPIECSERLGGLLRHYQRRAS